MSPTIPVSKEQFVHKNDSAPPQSVTQKMSGLSDAKLQKNNNNPLNFPMYTVFYNFRKKLVSTDQFHFRMI